MLSVLIYYLERKVQGERNAEKLTATRRDFLHNPRELQRAVLCSALSVGASLIGGKEGAFFSLSYSFESLCIYYIPHNYTIPQAMPHAIPRTHSSF